MKYIGLVAALGLMSFNVAAAEQTSQPTCDAGFTSIVTGNYSKTPQHTCLPTDNKQAVKIKLNQTFQLSLPASPSTGFSWALRSMPNALMLLSIDYHNSEQCQKGMTGCSGLRTYTFKAVTKGVGELKLNYGRSWEKEDWETKTITIAVHQ
ncbi:Chagasin family peptidase inhibitor I42 [Photobacterium piscicola]|uniref:Chagasin family peptidase inhibitor I42 n=1 Tax=Photobacterium piscicola TaxID=1378299 RepID=A0A1T5HWJ6_9GAMM|nr:protease inhibitor I42 family protein [Photobacterium piscicola]SKC31122.1 Chagasin family peptidase inhibitor I42 [Photobacterium piscicola]